MYSFQFGAQNEKCSVWGVLYVVLNPSPTNEWMPKRWQDSTSKSHQSYNAKTYFHVAGSNARKTHRRKWVTTSHQSVNSASVWRFELQNVFDYRHHDRYKPRPIDKDYYILFRPTNSFKTSSKSLICHFWAGNEYLMIETIFIIESW